VREELVTTPEEAAEAAARIGDRVVLKAAGPVHKTEASAVRLDLAPEQVAEEAVDIARGLADRGDAPAGFIVQELVRDGTEMLVGAAADPVFGPVVAVGAGGVTVELTRDVAVRVAPLTDRDADEMVRELATFPLLDGFRGAAKKDVSALVDVILRVGALADRHPEIAEMDLNPVMVLPRGAVVVDARIRVRPVPAEASHAPASPADAGSRG
jgi:acyl-CoA synthetase (NDP forming)